MIDINMLKANKIVKETVNNWSISQLQSNDVGEADAVRGISAMTHSELLLQ